MNTMILKRVICLWVLFSFLGTSITPLSAQAQTAAVDLAGLSFRLPKPGIRVDLSPAFEPVLIKGLKIHPENPFKFDFIVDPGQEKLSADDFKKTSQRLVNYFLASLAVPEKDLWVNLSPVEKDRIIPDTLIKTELGRDLLAEDYMLKQVGASLIYPESSFGKLFWKKVYDDAYRKFGVTQIPVDIINKIWIVPQKASVFEKGNTVYIVNAHLKVMLEEDLLAQGMLGKKINAQKNDRAVKDISKQVMREVVIPVIEKEVNEGQHFAQLRQVFYAIILAQWYQDAFKGSVLNRIYAGHNKVAGIDISDPANKELIYRQYLSAFKKGVFNYIKEDIDRVSQQAIPRKYFSGGFKEQKVRRNAASLTDLAMNPPQNNVAVSVDLAALSQLEPLSSWNDLNRPLGILKELRELLKSGKFKRKGLYELIDKYSAQVDSMKLYPVQSAWPVLKAITLLEKSEEDDFIAALQEKYSNPERPELVDKILLMNSIFDREQWLKERAPDLVGRRIYMTAAEIHYWAGGLGPVMKFHGKGMKDLGADVAYIEPWYQLRRDKGNPSGDPLNYEDPDIGLTNLDEHFDEFDVDLGSSNGKDVQKVHVRVARGTDQNGITVYMFRDVLPDGQGSFYTKMLYNYRGLNNPITQEESMSFLNVASAELIKRLETKRKAQQPDWKPAVVHSNDGQYAPLQAVTMSRHGSDEVIKDIFWAFTTHTYRNRGGNRDNVQGTIYTFLMHMMGIKKRFINAFRGNGYIDFTSGGVRLASWAGAVSDKHRDDVQVLDPNVNLVSVTNGAVPEEMAAVFREEFNKLKVEEKIPATADFERPTAIELYLAKRASKARFNEAHTRMANGGTVKVDLDRPLIGLARRNVTEKVARNRAFSDENIWLLVQLGFNVVFMGNNQGTPESDDIDIKLRHLQVDIEHQKRLNPKKFPGNFQFVNSFTASEKKLFLAAADIQIQDSDNHTGAAEFSEEDITSAGGLQGGGSFREGVIVDQGIPLDFNHPGVGQTLIPKNDTPQSWADTVYRPLMALWNREPEHTSFYQNAALSPRLNRIQRYLITSAAYLRQYENGIRRQEQQALENEHAAKQIVAGLGGNKELIDKILNDGQNGVRRFEFNIFGKGVIPADGEGLKQFLTKKEELEETYGYDVFLNHLNQGDFQNYLRALFDNTGSAELLRSFLRNMDSDFELSALEKRARLAEFIDDLVTELDKQLYPTTPANAAMAAPGGIKFDHISLEHHGSMTADLVSNKSFEEMLLNAQIVRGVIVGITPIPDLLQYIK